MIPKGDYCYSITNIENNKDISKVKIHTEQCPYYSMRPNPDYAGEISGYCSLMKKFDLLLDDQVKICNINNEFVNNK